MKNTPVIKSRPKLNFDLFSLDSKIQVKSPKSWLWCEFDSKKLKQAYLRKLEVENQNKIGLVLSKNINCGESTAVKCLIKLRKAQQKCSLPAIFLNDLCQYLDQNLKPEVINSINYFFFNNRLSKPVKAVHQLSEEFAEFLGSFAADGYFHQHNCDYYIKITEGNWDTIEILAKKIKNLFNFNSSTTFADNAWTLWIKNKVICRYFENIFNFKPGKKADTIRMPIFIREADFSLKRSFLRGVFTFDGCVKTNGNVGFTTKSRSLLEDITEVLDKDKITYKINYNKNKQAWALESSSGRNKELLKKWKLYFFENSIKYQRIRFFEGELKINDIRALDKLFPIHHHNKVHFREIYTILTRIKTVEIEELLQELRKDKIEVANTTLYKSLHLLTCSGLISKKNYQVRTKNNAFQKTIYFTELSKDLINNTGSSLQNKSK